MDSGRWQNLMAVDFDKWAARTYAANFPGVDVRCAGVETLVEALPAADVLLGGPPCQPFSDAGENEGENDERDCIPDFIAAVARVKPRMFLMENVRGLLKVRHWPYFCRVLEHFAETGYVVRWKLLDSVSFGVPQFRERVWVWGIRSDLYADGIRHAWPAATHAWPPPEPCMFGAALLAGITVEQALGLDDPSVPTDRPATTLRSGGDGHDGCCLRLIATDDPVKWRWSDAMFDKQPPIELDKPCPTIVKNWHKGVPYGAIKWKETPDGLWIRRLHPLECARLQSVPDDFKWPEDLPKTHAYRVVGNGQASLQVWHLSQAMAKADPESRTVVSLFCGGGIGDVGFHGRFWSYTPVAEMEVV